MAEGKAQGKRERIDPSPGKAGGSPFVRRDRDGQFTSDQVDAGRSVTIPAPEHHTLAMQATDRDPRKRGSTQAQRRASTAPDTPQARVPRTHTEDRDE